MSNKVVLVFDRSAQAERFRQMVEDYLSNDELPTPKRIERVLEGLDEVHVELNESDQSYLQPGEVFEEDLDPYRDYLKGRSAD